MFKREHHLSLSLTHSHIHTFSLKYHLSTNLSTNTTNKNTGTIGICASFDIIAEYLRVEFAPNLIDLCVEVERTQSAKDKKTDSIKQLVSKRIRMFGTLL